MTVAFVSQLGCPQWVAQRTAVYIVPGAYGQTLKAAVEIEGKMDLLQDGLRIAVTDASKNVTSVAERQDFAAALKSTQR